MTQTVATELIIGARDESKAALSAVQKNLGRVETSATNLGEGLGRSGELAGRFFSQVLGVDLGPLADGFENLTGQLKDFKDASASGAENLGAIKAGLGVGVGIAAFTIGKQIGEVVFQTQQWKLAMEAAREEAAQLAGIQLGNVSRAFNQERERIGLLIDPAEQEQAVNELQGTIEKNLDGLGRRIRALQKEINEGEEFFFKSEDFKAQLQAQKENLDFLKQNRDVLRGQLQTIREENSERSRNIELLRQKKAAFEQSQQFVEGLREEVKLLKMTADERMRSQVAAIAVGPDAQKEALALLREKQAIEKQAADRKKAEAEAAKEMAKAAKEQLDLERQAAAIVQQNMTDFERFQAEMRKAVELRRKGLLDDDQFKRQVESLKNQLKSARDKGGSGRSATLQANQSRFLSGRQDSIKREAEQKPLLDIKSQLSTLLTFLDGRKFDDILSYLETIASKEDDEVLS